MSRRRLKAINFRHTVVFRIPQSQRPTEHKLASQFANSARCLEVRLPLNCEELVEQLIRSHVICFFDCRQLSNDAISQRVRFRDQSQFERSF